MEDHPINCMFSLAAFYEQVCDLYLEGVTIRDILLHVNNQLYQDNMAIISEWTLYTQLRKWQLNTRHEPVEISEELIQRVKH